MGEPAALITQGTRLALQRAPRKTLASPKSALSLYDSEEFAYLVNVDIGGQDFWVTFDTGSSDLWIVTTDCDSADCTGVAKYSPSGSTTLALSSNPFRLAYLLGAVAGLVGTETVTLGSYQIASQTFALANQTSGLDLTHTGNSGILGLSFAPAAAIPATAGTTVLDNLFGHLGEANRFFAFALGRNDTQSGRSTASSFTIGELDPAIVRNASAVSFFPVFRTAHSPCDYWKLPIHNITLGGVPLPLSRSLVPGARAPIGVLDSGTTLVLGPSADVVAFWNAVGTGNSVRYSDQSGTWQVRCDRALDVRIQLGEEDAAQEFALHPEDVSWAEGGTRDGWCTGGLQANDGVSSGDWILGDVFLRNVYVVHQGATSSSPPMIGLLGLTDPQSALASFQGARGPDPAPPATLQTIRLANHWQADIKAATALCAIGGFIIGSLATVACKVRRREKKLRRW